MKPAIYPSGNDEKKQLGRVIFASTSNDLDTELCTSLSSTSTSSISQQCTRKRLDQSSSAKTTTTRATNNHANSSPSNRMETRYGEEYECDDKVSISTPPSAAGEVCVKKNKKGRSSTVTAVYPVVSPFSAVKIIKTNLAKMRMTAAAILLLVLIANPNSSFTSAFIIQPKTLVSSTRISSSSSALQMVSTTERLIRKSRIRKTKVATGTRSRAASTSGTGNSNRSKTRSRTNTISSTATSSSSNAGAAATAATISSSGMSSTSRTSASKKRRRNTVGSRTRNTKTAVSGQHKSKKRSISSSKTKVLSLAKTAESLYNLPSSYGFDGNSLHFEGERGVVLRDGREVTDQERNELHETVPSKTKQSKTPGLKKINNEVTEDTMDTLLSSDGSDRKGDVKKRRAEDKLEKSKKSMKSADNTRATTSSIQEHQLDENKNDTSDSSSMSNRTSKSTGIGVTSTGGTRTSTPTARIKTITNLSKGRAGPGKSAQSKNKSSRARSATVASTTTKRSRSSTMPGFRNREHTKRRTSFRDGMKIVQDANSHMSNNRMIYNSESTRGQAHNSRTRSHSRSNHKDSIKTKINNAVNSEKERRTRGKANSEAMYSTSASVPDSLIAFTNEIHMEERITPKQEIELGMLTQEAIRLQKLYDNLISKNGREPSDEEWCAAAGKINMEALQDAIEEGIEAKNQLVTSNLRMVQGVVNLYIRNGLGSQYNAGDLMQEGTVALIRAAEKFEPQRGFRFSTYAMYWIRAAVKRSQILQSRVINVPQRLHETHKKVTRMESQLKKELGRKPTSAELAVASGLTESQLERCLTAISQQCFSLDAEIANTLKPNSGDRSTETSYNLISAKYDDVEYRELQSHLMKNDLVSTLKRYLSPHEVDLLLLRYGLMDEKTLPYGFSGPLTIAEVSRLVGLKPDKVRRMINKSLRQLRHLIAHEWEDFESVLQRY